MGDPPPEILPMHPTSINSGGSLLRMRLLNSLRAKNISCTNSHILYRVGGGGKKLEYKKNKKYIFWKDLRNLRHSVNYL